MAPKVTQRMGLELSRRRMAAILAAAVSAPILHAATKRTTLGIAADALPSQRGSRTEQIIDLCLSWGMGGAQSGLTFPDAQAALAARTKLEKHGIFLVATVSINDTERFRVLANLAKEAGVVALRVASGGRRYEQFQNREDRQAHVRAVEEGLARAIPIAESVRIPIGLENHKDFTIDEHVDLYRRYSSEYFGACVDTGNNLALLEDPIEPIDRLAPHAVLAHLKDATLEEYPDGFLLGDIPLGEGMLDLPRIVGILHKHRPKLPIVLECITRNPLKIPCLTDAYWKSFPKRDEEAIARTMRLVRANRPKWQMKVSEEISREELAAMESKHVERCIAYASKVLGLV
jgi:sugar phosphate isomerase/epimerase